VEDPQIGVRDLIARYCAAVVAFDREQFLACWQPDARWVAKGTPIAGIERIGKVFLRARGMYPLCVQVPLSTVVTQADGVVSAVTQVHELQWVSGKVAGVELFGIYRDVCVRVGDTWRFAERAFDELYRGPRLFPGHLTVPAVS
jgi:hypothetical protein